MRSVNNKTILAMDIEEKTVQGSNNCRKEHISTSLFFPHNSTDENNHLELILALHEANTDITPSSIASDSYLFPSELLMPSLEKETTRLDARQEILHLRDDNHSREAQSIACLSSIADTPVEPYACYHFDPDECISMTQESPSFAEEKSPVSKRGFTIFGKDQVSSCFEVKSQERKPTLRRSRDSLQDFLNLASIDPQIETSAMAA
eukprot:CAMPEP_0195511358 /NCGR_PEP_ID=MMETSP0794_2-20130614/3701_1 /TAXON_ID=515487 /ORGANISM="Stephanopyxis turris, Strain CCMP 815" /LENGTH=205 /DNA_ID=CAMNT_0040638937 /DNA_START=239 /DNA_END=856 /DNA_ORIENTATION=+